MAGESWYEIRQKNALGYSLTFFCLKAFPAWFLRILAFPIGFFYWIFSKKARGFSKKFGQIWREFVKSVVESAVVERSRNTEKFSTLRHIVSFALNLVENLEAWAGKFSFSNVRWREDDVRELARDIDSGRGTLILISHLGNAQMLKALASAGESGTERKMSITTISDANVSAGFNALLKKVNGDSAFHLVSSDEIGPDTVIMLQERLEKGEVVVVAGDRVGAHSDRVLEIDFLGRRAEFPYGVFVLVSLLDVPTYFVNGIRIGEFSLRTEYEMFVRKNRVEFSGGRKIRNEKIRQTAENYARNLENLCSRHPYQWYNFYDFWRKNESF